MFLKVFPLETYSLSNRLLNAYCCIVMHADAEYPFWTSLLISQVLDCRTETQIKHSCLGLLSGGMSKKRRAQEEGLTAASSSNDVAMKRQRAQILPEPAIVQNSFHPSTAGLTQGKTCATSSPKITDNDKKHLPEGDFPKVPFFCLVSHIDLPASISISAMGRKEKKASSWE